MQQNCDCLVHRMVRCFKSQFVVYHDAPRLLRDTIPVAALPRAIRALHVKDDSPGLTAQG